MRLKELEVLYHASNVVISWNAGDRFLYIDWIGFQEEAALKSGGEKILEFMKEKECSKVLNDNTRVIGLWYHSVDWTSSDWFPRMIAAGLKHFAWICSDDVFTQLSSRRAIPPGNIVRDFASYDDALQWLLQQE